MLLLLFSCYFTEFKADDYDDDDDDEDSVLNFDSGCAPKKPRAGSSIATTTGQPTTVGYNQWCPIHSIIRWKDRMLREHITVAMALPSGLIADGLNGKFTPSVSNDGKILTVKCAWPNLLSDTDSMELGWSRQKGLTTRELVNMVVAAEQEIKDLRKHLGITRGDQLFSIATMKLPSECEREIVNMVTCSDRIKGGIVVYLVLKVRIEDTEEGDIDMSVQDISSLRTSGVSLSTKLTYDNIMSQALENFAENITPRAVPTKGLPKGNTRSSTTGKRKSKGTDKENYSGKSQNYM